MRCTFRSVSYLRNLPPAKRQDPTVTQLRRERDSLLREVRYLRDRLSLAGTAYQPGERP